MIAMSGDWGWMRFRCDSGAVGGEGGSLVLSLSQPANYAIP